MSYNITIHSSEDFVGMRKAGKLAAETLDYIVPYVKVGVTTNELNDVCHNFIIKHGAIPAPLNYKGYPKSICTSKNHVICHGIPNDKQLSSGDILNIDVTVILDGWHGDTSRMFFVGKPSIKANRLCQATYEALMLSIEQIKPGRMLNDIGKTIQKHIDQYGYSIVRDYCGHGLGKVFHTQPNVVHYSTEEKDVVLEEGMFFTIEPMINAGKYHTILNRHNGWTVTTKDMSLSAQFEHSIGVTADAAEIFTTSPQGLDYPPYHEKK